MTIQQDLTFSETHLPAIKKVAKVLAVAVVAVTIWKGVHGFFPTLGLSVGVGLYLIGDLL
jgi:hypothetical protein